ncbi:MFS18 protein-like [Sesamum indicum]|uniref:MFS18 protein-like n=1 Tax=Sesamum indicum TaxID=4182 RepID=A0A6I9U2P7_SESIN|nr:MFS18 protein-like [Sesamum indicum]
MEGFAKVLLILTLLLGVLSMDVKGGRALNANDDHEVVDQPQTFGSFGGTFPAPFPGLGGSFPGSGLGGSFPGTGLGGSLPNPSMGSGSSTSSFCSFPGVRCAPLQPGNSGGSSGGVGASP